MAPPAKIENGARSIDRLHLRTVAECYARLSGINAVALTINLYINGKCLLQRMRTALRRSK